MPPLLLAGLLAPGLLVLAGRVATAFGPLLLRVVPRAHGGTLFVGGTLG